MNRTFSSLRYLMSRLSILCLALPLASFYGGALSAATPTPSSAPAVIRQPATQPNPPAAAAPSPPLPIAAPNPPIAAPVTHAGFTAVYRASLKGLPLQATHTLKRAGKDWLFSSISSGFFGEIEENSLFAYSDKGILPKSYTYRRSVLGQNRENALIYNYTDKLALSTAEEKSWKIPLRGEEQDLGTYLLALRDDVAQGKKDSCYRVVEERGVDEYCFRVTGREILDTALGKLPTVVVERVRKPSSPRRTRYWLVPSLAYSIAKLEHQESKDQLAYSLELTSFQPEPDKKKSSTIKPPHKK